jgi:hypothetical protein
MHVLPETSAGRVVETDRQGRRLAVLGEDDRMWAAGFSYTLSWDEAMGYALTAVAASMPQFNFDLWPTQVVLPEPGTASVLQVGFYFTPRTD